MAIQLVGSNLVNVVADSVSSAVRAGMYDENNNPLLVTNGTNLPTIPAGVPLGGVDDGSGRVMRLDRYGNTRLGFDNLIFFDCMEANAINTQIWTLSTTTYTQAQLPTTGINMNSAASAAAGASSILTSQKQFFKSQQVPMRVRIRARAVPSTNTVVELGFGNPTGNTAQIPVGACWRYTTTGTVVPVIQYNGTDVVTGNDISGSINSANYYTWEIVVDDDQIFFFCQDVSTGYSISEQTLNIPIVQARTWSVSHLPLFARLYTTGSAPSVAPLMYVSEVTAVSLDLVTNKPWQHIMATVGKGQEIIPTTYAQAANFANSTAPTTAVLSNTAASYTTLGGVFAIPATLGAVTDYCLFGFTVPAPYSFYCTGIHITTYNTGATGSATTLSTLHWAVGANSASANLSTGVPLHVAVGAQYFPINAVIGQCADKDIDYPFEVPLRTEAGKVLAVIVRLPVGAATASQIFDGSVLVRGYFE